MSHPKPSRALRPIALLGLLLATAFSANVPTTAVGGGSEDRDCDRGEDRGERGDPVVLSFSTVGDSRQDPVTADPTTLPLSGQDKIWLQNTKAWSRIMRAVAEDRSNFLFFNGDMIMGYGKAEVPTDTSSVDAIVKSDLMAFYRQYAFWRGMVADLMETGTYVVPVPGNHETQSKALGKKAQVENENAWRANMGDLILDTPRFQDLFGAPPTNATLAGTETYDGLATSQAQLSYSFDFRDSHFAIVNTDPVGRDSHAPSKWLEKDLGDAKARGAKAMFVFGHKPAFTYYYGSAVPTPPATPLPGKASGLDVDVAARDAFWDVIEKYDATYFCGHEHIYNLSQPRGSGHSWQVLVGSGGSPFEAAPADATISDTDRMYAWAEVRVHKSGKVKLVVYGFDDHFGPTHRLAKQELAH